VYSAFFPERRSCVFYRWQIIMTLQEVHNLQFTSFRPYLALLPILWLPSAHCLLYFVYIALTCCVREVLMIGRDFMTAVFHVATQISRWLFGHFLRLCVRVANLKYVPLPCTVHAGKKLCFKIFELKIKLTPFPSEMSSKRRIITITIRDIILRPLFCLKHNVSDIGFCLRL
jgi:hypothetical protein